MYIIMIYDLIYIYIYHIMSSEALPRVVPELLHSKHSSVSKCFFQWSPLVFVLGVRFRVEFQITKRSVLVTWLRCQCGMGFNRFSQLARNVRT